MLGNAVPERTANFGWPAVYQVPDLCFYFLSSSFLLLLIFSLFSNNATRHDLPNRQSINLQSVSSVQVRSVQVRSGQVSQSVSLRVSQSSPVQPSPAQPSQVQPSPQHPPAQSSQPASQPASLERLGNMGFTTISLSSNIKTSLGVRHSFLCNLLL